MAARKSVIGLSLLWVCAVAFGLHSLMVYKGTPGVAGEVPDVWPRNDVITPSFKKPQLIMFAHPRCPCTKASLSELEFLIAKARDDFEAAVVFYEPGSEMESWSETPSVDLARSIPGVRVVLDSRGGLTDRFGAETSGHTVVYGTEGRLLFTGGITGSRGHIGENTGFDAVLQLIGHGSSSSSPMSAKVFGCPIFDRCESNQTPEN